MSVVHWRVVASQPWHVERMAPHVREADRRELWSGWRSLPEDSLRHGLERSSHCWTGLLNFRPVCMVGVVPQSLLGGAGTVWLIGTDALAQHSMGFLRRCRPQLRIIRGIYSRLSNHVAAENRHAVAWLRWLEFEIHPAQPFGYDGEAFHHFEWSACAIQRRSL